MTTQDFFAESVKHLIKRCRVSLKSMLLYIKHPNLKTPFPEGNYNNIVFLYIIRCFGRFSVNRHMCIIASLVCYGTTLYES